MPYLSWISDEDLSDHVQYLLDRAEAALQSSQRTFHRNVIDPFSALFQMYGFDIDHEVWLKSEETRQSQKTLQNHIGTFHQKILGSIEGWDDLGIGGFMDVKSDSKQIIAEVKNKHNTVTGSALVDVYKNLEDLVMPRASIYNGFTAYFVNIIPARPERTNIPFMTSNRGTGARTSSNELIRRIDGASFYHMVTGQENALKILFEVLPNVINDLCGKEMEEDNKLALTELFTRAYD